MRLRSALPHAVFAVLACALLAHAVTGELTVRYAAQFVAVALMGVQTIRRRDARAAWALLTLANATWAVGDLDPERLSALFMASFAFAQLGLVALVATHARGRWHSWLALDGVVVALAAAAIVTRFVYAAFDGVGMRVPVTALAGDAMLTTTIVLAFAINGWRPARGWWVIAAGEAILVTIDLALAGAGRPTPLMSVGWATALVLTSYAAFQPTAVRHGRLGVTASATVAVGGGAVAVGVLMATALSGGGAVTVWLAGAALIVGLVRAAGMIVANDRLLRRTRAEAVTDKLTGLPNRRALTEDLERAFAGGRAHTLAFFDLDGFKEYNDAHGHAAGDALLQRLAARLGGYRLGGDEFCVLLAGVLDDDSPAIRAAVEALSEDTISASFGLVALPAEAGAPAAALALADERMYARKRRRRRRSAGEEFLRAGRRLGLDAGELEALFVATLSDGAASSAAPAPAGSSAAPSGSARRSSPGS